MVTLYSTSTRFTAPWLHYTLPLLDLQLYGYTKLYLYQIYSSMVTLHSISTRFTSLWLHYTLLLLDLQLYGHTPLYFYQIYSSIVTLLSTLLDLQLYGFITPRSIIIRTLFSQGFGEDKYRIYLLTFILNHPYIF